MDLHEGTVRELDDAAGLRYLLDSARHCDREIDQPIWESEVFRLIRDTAVYLEPDRTDRVIAAVNPGCGTGRLTPAIAMALFAAIATDTGWFRFSSVSEETFATVARLVDADSFVEDALLAIVQMPSGVPVATVALRLTSDDVDGKASAMSLSSLATEKCQCRLRFGPTTAKTPSCRGERLTTKTDG